MIKHLSAGLGHVTVHLTHSGVGPRNAIQNMPHAAVILMASPDPVGFLTSTRSCQYCTENVIHGFRFNDWVIQQQQQQQQQPQQHQQQQHQQRNSSNNNNTTVATATGCLFELHLPVYANKRHTSGRSSSTSEELPFFRTPLRVTFVFRTRA